MAVGDTSIITIVVTVPSVNATLTNPAHVSTTTPDNNPGNNDSTVTTVVQGPPGNPITPITPPLITSLQGFPYVSKNQLMGDSGMQFIDPTLVGQLAVVDGVYKTLTGSSAAVPTTLTTVQGLLVGSTTIDQVVGTVYNSDAHRALQAQNLYQTYLGRTPTAAEQATVVQALQSGATERSQVVALLSSPAYQQLHPTSLSLATALSQDIQGQTPNGVSAQALVQALGNQTLAQAVDTLLSTPEGLNRTVDQTFRDTVRRPASAAELAQYSAQLQAGTITTDMLTQKLLASQEFFQLAFNSLQ
jgi:hypothetical protein